MSESKAAAIALDVGGTSVKAGLVDPSGALIGTIRHFESHSEREAEAVLTQFAVVLEQLRLGAAGRRVAGIGVGMPGPFDYDNGVSLIQGLGKYDAIYGVNLAAEWRRRLAWADRMPIRFINDAAAFALGVSLYGPGRGFRRTLAVTLGTGCGAAFVVDGRIVTEGPGVPRGGEVYHLPFRGAIIDEWISRRGILRLWRETAPTPELPGIGAEPDVKDLALAALAGNRAACALFGQWGRLLAEALIPVAQEFRPDCLVLGGQIARSLPLFGQHLEAGLAAIGCRLADSEDPAAGVRGAASLIWRA